MSCARSASRREWIGAGAQPYSEVIEAWRTSCPRLPVWEEASARGYLTRTHSPGGVAEVRVSEAGAAHLRASRSVSRQDSQGGLKTP